MSLIYVPLELDERVALAKLAKTQKRDKRFQAAAIIRAELERAGLIAPAMRIQHDEQTPQPA